MGGYRSMSGYWNEYGNLIWKLDMEMKTSYYQLFSHNVQLATLHFIYLFWIFQIIYK